MYKYFTEKEVVGLNERLVQMLDCARDFAGIPFVITSGLRSPAESVKAGGSETDAHVSGFAVDLRCRGSRERFLIIKALISVGFTRIGDEIDHIHADIDPEKDTKVIWR